VVREKEGGDYLTEDMDRVCKSSGMSGMGKFNRADRKKPVK
jgi:hypothetical protein